MIFTWTTLLSVIFAVMSVRSSDSLMMLGVAYVVGVVAVGCFLNFSAKNLVSRRERITIKLALFLVAFFLCTVWLFHGCLEFSFPSALASPPDLAGNFRYSFLQLLQIPVWAFGLFYSAYAVTYYMNVLTD